MKDPRRSPKETEIEIIIVLEAGEMKPTHISHKTNMSYIALQSALAHLIATGQVIQSGETMKHSRRMYTLTVRGKASAKAAKALDEALAAKPLSDGF